ncbi:carbohydrate esterase family 4 protein [Piromyces sp. E2]|nr:carbohydrate esterase family 4 protein [Piromyces sp. E2]|eukprot:OUM61640.1 carbohydrate esterase family 4 protein [Piromyces sp. E2]
MRFSTIAALGFASVASAALIEHCIKPNTVALTFDDGPFEYTNKLLDTLKAANIKATFFINGENYWPDLVNQPENQLAIKRAHAEGHQVASHTWQHKIPEIQDDVMDVPRTYESLSKIEQLIYNNTGVYPTYFRAPKGEITEEYIKFFENIGYRVIQWDYDPNDWKSEVDGIEYKDNYGPRVKKVKEELPQVAAEKRENYLILMHDAKQSTVEEIVPFLIENKLFDGYQFVTVAECLGDPTGGWSKIGNAITVMNGGKVEPVGEISQTTVPANNTLTGNRSVAGTDADKMNLEKSGAMTSTVSLSVFITLFMSALYMLF